MKVVNEHSGTTRGWRRKSPKSKTERRALKQKCGVRAFLQPGTLKFPVMGAIARSGGQECAYDCEGIRAAYARANQYGYSNVAKKAKKLGTRAGCRWARPSR